MANYFDVVFDGPPGPECGRFVEVENEEGRSISIGEWVERGDGYWALRIPTTPAVDLLAAAEKMLANLNARIDQAQSDAKPVFDGIADLHDAVNKARGQN